MDIIEIITQGLFPLLSTGGCLYLIIDKVLLSRAEKAAAHTSEAQAVGTSYEALRQVINDLKANNAALQKLYDESLSRYADVTSSLSSTQSELTQEINEHGKTMYVLLQALQYIREEEKNNCKRLNCPRRTPPHPDSATPKTYELQLHNYREEFGVEYSQQAQSQIVASIQEYLSSLKASDREEMNRYVKQESHD